MIKTIRVNESESFNIDTTAWWLFIYRQQFGRDILPDLLPAIEALLKIYAGVLSAARSESKENEITLADFMKNVADDETIADACACLSGVEFITLYRIAWAMAKNADQNVPDIETWIKGFDELPMDTMGKEIIDAVISSTVSSKNASRLKAKMRMNTSILNR